MTRVCTLLFWLVCILPLAALAQQQDSIAQEVAIKTSAYRYVNASSLMLRSAPDASATPLAKLAGASRVLVLQDRPGGWCQIKAAAYTGYVKSDYLVEEQDAITAEVDWAAVEAAGTTFVGVSAASTGSTAHATTPVRRAAPKPATGPKVYICGNGRTEVYHSSGGCSAMRRCTYQTLFMTAGQARSSGLRECMKCY